jgi:hypothetical protein
LGNELTNGGSKASGIWYIVHHESRQRARGSLCDEPATALRPMDVDACFPQCVVKGVPVGIRGNPDHYITSDNTGAQEILNAVDQERLCVVELHKMWMTFPDDDIVERRLAKL